MYNTSLQVTISLFLFSRLAFPKLFLDVQKWGSPYIWDVGIGLMSIPQTRCYRLPLLAFNPNVCHSIMHKRTGDIKVRLDYRWFLTWWTIFWLHDSFHPPSIHVIPCEVKVQAINLCTSVDNASQSLCWPNNTRRQGYSNMKMVGPHDIKFF